MYPILGHESLSFHHWIILTYIHLTSDILQRNFHHTKKNGSLVIALNEKEVEILKELMERGETNGVKRLKILNKQELFDMEPAINPEAIAALYSPDAGNVIPYEYAIALAENAVDNGVELRIRREVVGISKNDDGEFALKVGTLVTT